MITIRYYRRV